MLASFDARAAEALDLFVYRIGCELDPLAAALEGIDALVLTRGIGENAIPIRARICSGAGWLGLDLDEQANAAGGPRISPRWQPRFRLGCAHGRGTDDRAPHPPRACHHKKVTMFQPRCGGHGNAGERFRLSYRIRILRTKNPVGIRQECLRDVAEPLVGRYREQAQKKGVPQAVRLRNLADAQIPVPLRKSGANGNLFE